MTRDFQDGIVLDKGMGRSAYICPKKECFEEALRRKRLQKALRCQVPLTVFDLLQNRLNENKHSNSEER
ncbi:hypothetical protein EV05_0177 [Prochlorococcus sp. MIT 0601]|nr:hypothetical protein EV05_0177 [Prochlorococcus sp. MIT 0601]